MIRTAWAFFFAALTTSVLGSIVVVAAMLKIRGKIYSDVSRNWARALLWASSSSVRIHGADRVDWSRPHVLVTNHTGSYEILALAVAVPVHFRFVAKRELEKVPIFGPAWKSAGHISIDRSNRQLAIESLRKAGEIIREEGGIIIIFPEGTRSKTGELQPFKKGAFLLALEARVPILPTVVTGSDEILAPGRLRIRPGTMDLYFGDPIPVDMYGDDQVEDLMAEVHGTMRRMLEAARSEALAG